VKMMKVLVCVIALWGAAGGARSCGESRRVYGEKHELSTAPHTHQRSTFLYNFFRELMDVAEKSMNQMFTQTYGHLYTQNAPIFQQLFSDLRRYYTGGRVSVAEVLSDFWAGLVERVFALVNPQYQFSEDYLECVSKHAEQLRPFGDVPHKLHIQVSRALTAARTLVQSLAAGRDIVNKATKLTVGSECVRALMRQWFCPLCRGLPFLKPCHSLCLNVMKGCLANQADLDSEWNNFIDALMAVVEKLSGPFHFELAADSIAVKVSEGIMYMQENSISISAKVFQGCGIPRPTPARNKRSSRERDGKRAFRTYSAEDKPTTASGTNLDRLVRSIVKPNPTTGKICKHVGRVTFTCVCVFCRYLPPVTADGLVNQINNPEMEVDVARPDVKTRQLIMELRVAVNRLKHALNGRDADLIDSECLRTGSGSGVGAESGERFSDDWPAYGSFSPPHNTLPVDKLPRPRNGLRPRDTPSNKRNRLNGRVQSDAGRLFPPLLPFLLLLTVCFSLSSSRGL
uniref:Glypican 2 n=1 Tax=Cyprinus carpio TaxID=7962 RepID=A0A8C1NQ94_CYPCA